MKSFVSLLFAFIANIALLSAQKTQDIPQLEEWWRAPENEKGLGRYGVSYLPNFYHGKDAMAVSINNGTMETWLNRFPGDRENIFTWKGGGPIKQGDFDGNGITDYIDGQGNVYRGIQNGEPPDTATVAKSPVPPGMITDLNHDGYDDILSTNSYEYPETSLITEVAYGSPNFTFRKVSVARPSVIVTTMVGEKAYRAADGDMRYIFFFYEKTGFGDYDGYALFRVHWEKGDTIPVFTKLSEVRKTTENGGLIFSRGGALYQSKHHDNIFFIAKEALGMYNHNVIAFRVNDDKFDVSLKFYWGNAGGMTSLTHSIDGDEFEDWVMYKEGYEANFLSGGIILDSIPRLRYSSICTSGTLSTGAGVIQTIGDVNGDNIPDLAMGTFSNIVPNCFRIVLGKKSITGIIEESKQPNSFTLTDPSPHPLSRYQSSILIVSIPKDGVYILELYSSDGKYLSEIYHQYFEAGKQMLFFDLSRLSLTAGVNSLRLRQENGVVIGSRLIIIQ